jgi:hypothetical protein
MCNRKSDIRLCCRRLRRHHLCGRHDCRSRRYCCRFLVDCCLPPPLPLFPSAAAVAFPRRCRHCLPAPLPMSQPPQPLPLFLPPSAPPPLPIFLPPSPLPLCFNISVDTIVSAKALSLTKSASLQVVRRQWRTVAADTMIKSDGKRGVYFR